MKNYWQEVKVGDIGEVVGGGTPSTKCSDYYGGDIPWITPKDLSNFRNRYISRGERMISKLGLENSSAKMLPPFSVLFTSRAPIGYIAIAKNELCTNQGFKSIIPDPKKCDALFLYYLLKYKKNDIESIANGSTFQEVSGTALKNFEVSIPPLDEQRKIAGILSALDDKIELNNKINQNLDWEDYFRICRRIYELEKENQNLEAQAQAIFKSWFIDFEPFKNGKFIDSELGRIPEGWKVVLLSNIANFEKGKKPKTTFENGNDGVIPYLTIEALSGGNVTYCETEKMVLAKENEILLVMDGASSGTLFYGMEGAVASTIAKLNSSDISLQEIIFEFISYRQEDLKSHNTGSAIPHLDKTYLLSYKMVIPSDKTLLLKVSSWLKTLRAKIIQNKKESQRLAQLRDTLLPKLMSGEIDVSDVAV